MKKLKELTKDEIREQIVKITCEVFSTYGGDSEAYKAVKRVEALYQEWYDRDMDTVNASLTALNMAMDSVL